MSSLLNVKAIFWLFAGIPFGFLFGFYRREIWIIVSLERMRYGFGIFNESTSYTRAVLTPLQHGRSSLERSFYDKAERNSIPQPASKESHLVPNAFDETSNESVVARINAARINNTSLLNASRNYPSLENKTAPEGVKEGRDWLWAKTRGAFRYIYEQGLLNKFDWFLKADDDTYVSLENLRYLVAWRNASDPIHYGCKFHTGGPPGGFMSGGGGYVLSKEAVRRLVEIAQPNRTLCRQDHDGSEDVEIGTCLGNVGVLAGDSRDSLGRHRFFPMSVDHFVLPSSPHLTSWVAGYSSFPIKPGQDCCSDYAITFHYISPQWLLVMDYLIYHLRPYGLSQTQRFVLKPYSSDQQCSSDYKLAKELVPLSLEDMANETRTSTTEEQSFGTYNETALIYQALLDAIALKAPDDNSTNSTQGS